MMIMDQVRTDRPRNDVSPDMDTAEGFPGLRLFCWVRMMVLNDGHSVFVNWNHKDRK